jgi:predicted transcriptional regulator
MPPRRRRKTVADYEAEKAAAIAAVVSEKELEKEAAIAAVVSEKELEKKAAFELGKLEGARYAAQCLCLVNTLCLMSERYASSCQKRCTLWAAPSSPWR